MAEKKTTQKVLSDRALELVMLNVLGGLGCILSQPPEMPQDLNKMHGGADKSQKNQLADSVQPGLTPHNKQPSDEKLNS
ncbi:MAG: hypothetical protein ABFS39_12225 [Pseudomonadota bacterium]